MMLRLVVTGGIAAILFMLMRRKAGEPATAWPEPRSAADGSAARAAAARGHTIRQREQAARELAGQLLFQMDKQGRRYSLFRDADVAQPVHRENLTLKEVEEILANWKLRGFHGG